MADALTTELTRINHKLNPWYCLAVTYFSLFSNLLQVMDALAMTYPDESFDLVWACESGEHMPDKKKYVEEMIRVLKPGGSLVIACWCQREETPENPITDAERQELQFLYDEWAHPYFISIQEFCRLMQVGVRVSSA